MSTLIVSRAATIPDQRRINRYRRTPELGPQVLFFSGGSALHGLSQQIRLYTHNSVHLVTPFDSGGSSAKLRQAFAMPAIGDLRHRMMALADDSEIGHRAIYTLFSHRLPNDASPAALADELKALCRGRHPLIAQVENPMRRLIRIQLAFFQEAMPPHFDLRRASIGNLILAGGYLNNKEHLDPIVFLFSKLVGVRGTVRTVVNDHLHLCVGLEDGTQLVGQHRMSGKELAPLTSPIQTLCLSQHPDHLVPAQAVLQKGNRRMIQEADLICYPPGSFYSSLLANLLPVGVAQAIANNRCPKVFVPSLGEDPELLGRGVDKQVKILLNTLFAGLKNEGKVEHLLQYVLLDRDRKWGGDKLHKRIRKAGVQVIETPLTHPSRPHCYDPTLLAQALLSLT
ncbi:protein of unknown function UPF0052 and CofD [Magnetococcus marinus MC-1]|uniref:GAK system CofD-like protein n=1 Tax=Magnetococcus marinus (strain ATCC BAA-1437 / JCM 17883 / MC-1) TaxID=156889 RepID=A0LAE3_MAGMM|nr:GAK system CofD-like protein [Magnetococcus marinus]ABK44936.1 protein of unknown function UPF0052 and CofD [Magnetococcus marinus MC-1]